MKDKFQDFIKQKGMKAKLARELGLTRAAICFWKRVPVYRVREVEKLTGIPREELRPDIFGKEER